MAQGLKNIFEAESKYYISMKVGLAHISGYAPAIAIEFARQGADVGGAAELHRNRRGDVKPASARLRPVNGGPLETPFVIKKVKKAAHAHHGGAWKIAYADFRPQ